MTTFGRFFNSLSVKIIGSIVIMVTLLSVLVGFLSYRVFTRTMLRETLETLERSAEFTMIDAVTWQYQDYFAIGADRMDELLESNFEKVRPEDPKWIEEATKAYFASAARMDDICRSGNITAIAIIRPDAEKNYTEYSIVSAYSVLNDEIAYEDEEEESEEAEDTEEENPEAEEGTEEAEAQEEEEEPEEQEEVGTDWFHLYEPTRLGDRYDLLDEDMRKAVSSLWKREKENESIIRFSEESSDIIGPKAIYLSRLEGGNPDPEGVLVLIQSIQPMVDTWHRFVVGISLIAIGMILIGVLLLGYYLRIRVVKPVDLITNEAYRFARTNKMANRTLTGNVGNITEICVLAESIDKMEEETMNHMGEIARMSQESDSMDTELAFASKLQHSVLPDAGDFSGRKEFHVAAKMNPAKEIGGDFYDFFMIDDTHLGLLVADVSDKGIGAALFMAVSKMLLKARARMGGGASEIISYVEEKLDQENKAGMFVTVWLGIVDLSTGNVNACNAGHNFPAVLKADSEEGYQIIRTEHGPPLCFLPGVPHVEYDFHMDPGDRLFLYTDGVTEAKNPEGDRFGNDRLIRALNDDRVTGDESLIIRVKAAVDLFAGEEPQFDDITMLSFTYLGKKDREENG